MTANTTPRTEDFPEAAKQFLQAFYDAKTVSAGSALEKINALRKAFQLEDTIVTADAGVSNDDEELKILEFYVLTKRGII